MELCCVVCLILLHGHQFTSAALICSGNPSLHIIYCDPWISLSYASVQIKSAAWWIFAGHLRHKSCVGIVLLPSVLIMAFSVTEDNIIWVILPASIILIPKHARRSKHIKGEIVGGLISKLVTTSDASSQHSGTAINIIFFIQIHHIRRCSKSTAAAAVDKFIVVLILMAVNLGVIQVCVFIFFVHHIFEY